MSELQTEDVKAPARRKTKKRKAAVKAAAKKDAGPFAGITAKACPTACTAKHCVISTVGMCKHPFKSSVNGCGPVTMENRDKALKFIKHHIIDATG